MSRLRRPDQPRRPERGRLIAGPGRRRTGSSPHRGAPAARERALRRRALPRRRDGHGARDGAGPRRGRVLHHALFAADRVPSPLHLALVELPGGAKFFCHGTVTKGLRPGSRVAIEAVDDIYYFSTLSLAERAGLFWRRRAETATGRVSAFAKSAAKRLLRRTR